MIIGFLASDLESLSLFKKVVQEHPLHGYVFYCDTAGTATFEEGVTFLVEKGCEVITVKDENLISKVEVTKPVHTVLTLSTLDSFLEGVAQEGTQAAVRIIHLTQHTKETDKKISSILGGFFIED